jgi:hypothetical protein
MVDWVIHLTPSEGKCPTKNVLHIDKNLRYFLSESITYLLVTTNRKTINDTRELTRPNHQLHKSINIRLLLISLGFN